MQALILLIIVVVTTFDYLTEKDWAPHPIAYMPEVLSLFLVLYVVVFVAGRLAYHRDLVADPSQIISIVGYVVVSTYAIVASVGVWRSAEPYWTSPIKMKRFWAGAARVVVIIWIANVARGLIVGGIMLLT